MKKNDNPNSLRRLKLWRKLLIVKLLCLCLFLQNTALLASVYSQELKLTLKGNDISLTNIFSQIRENSDYTFVYNLDDIQNVRVKSLDVKDASIREVLDKCLKGTGFSYEIEDHVVIIRPDRPAKQEVKKVTLNGLVMDQDSVPIAGVTVMLKGTYVGVTTDISGMFQMTILEQKEVFLLFSFVGMETREVKVTDFKRVVRVVMKEKVGELEEVVITGYGQKTTRTSTGSTASLGQDVFANKATPTVDMLLQGQVAGVSVMAVSGRPGEAAKVRIRGTNTISGDAEPLWVVDGVPLQQNVPNISTGQIKSGNLNEIFVTGIAGINPNDIENVTILKDASAAAIYGSRAAGGVIVITTKKGKAGKMRVNYSATLSVGLKPQRDPGLMNSAEKLAWEQELWDEFSSESFEYNKTASRKIHSPVVGIVGMLRSEKLGKDDKLWHEDNFEPMSGEEQEAYISNLAKHSTDWFDVLFRNSFSMNHHLSFSGGSKQYTYYVSLGVTDDKGLVKETDYQRYNLNAKIDLNPSARLNLGFGIDLSKQKSDSYSMTIDPFKYAYFANPYETLYNSDGSYRSDRTYFNLAGINDGNLSDGVQPPSGFNIMREMKETSSSADNTSGTVRVNLGYDIIEKLKISGLASYTYYNNKVDDVKGRDTYAAFLDRLYFDENNGDWIPYGSITQTSSDGTSYNVRGQLEYRDVFGDAHRIAVLGGAELRGDKSNRTYAKRFGYDDVTGNSAMPMHPNPQPEDVKRYADLIDQLSGEVSSESRFASFYASLDYSYLERYLLSVTFRTDGSNNFGSDEQCTFLKMVDSD
ncbi:SusC/RagA family TonB-linked outer membrane protein [Butyricimonas virosa]|uniref:SusC/RagA family TonB-linked outer membrane protein n=1 Tax=Butyricimonas virosa TaxID=544645 RepID=A0A415QKR2_9BACT|nr:SusC/RagA family TonB-linked outer membrane protein [Butyricimonas virosa]RHM44421.1 SusC/RagA family TonB-linked outer membrane protein [Butyricimonas virosa]